MSVYIHKLEKIYTQKKREQQQIWCLRQACHMTSGSGQSNCVHQSITWKWVLAALDSVTYLLLQISQLARPTRADHTYWTNFKMRCTTLAFNNNLSGRGMASEIISSKWRRFLQHGPNKWETICMDCYVARKPLDIAFRVVEPSLSNKYGNHGGMQSIRNTRHNRMETLHSTRKGKSYEQIVSELFHTTHKKHDHGLASVLSVSRVVF